MFTLCGLSIDFGRLSLSFSSTLREFIYGLCQFELSLFVPKGWAKRDHDGGSLSIRQETLKTSLNMVPLFPLLLKVFVFMDLISYEFSIYHFVVIKSGYGEPINSGIN